MNSLLIRILMITAVSWLSIVAPAKAATATYVIPASISSPELAALSTQGDGAGFLIKFQQTLGIVLDQPVGVSNGGNITVFTLQPDLGRARATIRIGTYNNGSPQFVGSRNINAGRSRSVGNLFRRGCGVLGGCDYIEIITTRIRRGENGVNIDYITVDGEVVQVASPTPEPGAWALMIIGFAAVSMRLKALRRRQGSSSISRAALGQVHLSSGAKIPL
jgi:hypothetical protein